MSASESVPSESSVSWSSSSVVRALISETIVLGVTSGRRRCGDSLGSVGGGVMFIMVGPMDCRDFPSLGVRYILRLNVDAEAATEENADNEEVDDTVVLSSFAGVLM